ncbi:MAG: hypothetical protein E7646_06715 [Ruminococcaceae bacterium]|nr:hypothetical protein [Oscillospiraceae bacterium]
MKIGVYEREITPPLGGDLPGYYAHRYATGVKERLYMRAAVFGGDGDPVESYAAVVSLDAVDTPKKHVDAITKRAFEYTGIPEENITVCSNHTHLGIPQGDVISDEDTVFMDVLCRLAADCITLAYRNIRENCSLVSGLGRVEGQSFVRDYLLDNGEVVTNASKFRSQIVRSYSEPDYDYPVLFALDEESKPFLCVSSFALHQDCVGGLEYSGDFSYYLSRGLKERYGEDFVSLYLAGASGDINHVECIGRTHSNYKETGKKLADEAVRLFEAGEKNSQSFATKRVNVKCSRRVPTTRELDEARWICEDRKNRRSPYDMTGQNAPLLLKYQEEFGELPVEMDVPVQVIRMGESFIFAIPGELYHHFGDMIKDAVRPYKAFICELSHMAAGYICTREMYKTQVYPVQLCHGSYFEPETGYKLVEAAVGLAKTMM